MGSSKQKTTSNSTSTATTTPNVPEYALGPTQNYYGMVDDLGQQIGENPQAFTTPANPLQQQAADKAGNLGGWGSLLSGASDMAMAAGTAPLPTVGNTFAGTAQASAGPLPTLSTYAPTTGAAAQGTAAQGTAQTGTALFGNAVTGSAQMMAAPQRGQAATYTPTMTGAIGYQAPTLAPAAQATAGPAVGVPTMGPAAQAKGADFGGAQAGPAAQATLFTADAANLGPANQMTAAKMGPAAQAGTTLAQNSSVMDRDLTRYTNPYQQQIIDATIAKFDDQAARARNAMEAAAGKNKAFGGSGYAIQSAQFDADTGLNRAMTLADLLNKNWSSAMDLAKFDTGNDLTTKLTNAEALNRTSLFNTGELNDTSEANARFAQEAGLFNTGQVNDFLKTQAGFKQDTNLANMRAANENSTFNTSERNTTDRTNAGLANTAGIANADRSADVSKFNAGETNALARSLADMQLRAGISNADRFADTSRFNASETNTTSRAQADLIANALRDTTQAQNTALLSNQSAANRAGEFNAGETNDFESQYLDQLLAANTTNTNAANDMTRFNLGQTNDMTRTNVTEGNTMARANLDALNSMEQTNIGERNAMTRANLDATNTMTGRNMDATNRASEVNATEANDMATSLFGTLTDLNQFNTSAINDNQRFNAGTANDNARFNASQGTQEVANRLAAAGQLSSNAGLYGNLSQDDIATQLSAGNTMYDIQRAQDMAPVTNTALLGEMLDPALLAQISGQTIDGTENGTSTVKQSGGLLGSLLGGAFQLGSAAIMKSERRVKRDISLVGREADGLGSYDYRYVWDAPDAPLRRGVMVDEVEALRPWALGPIVDGIQTVDYSQLEAAR